MNYANIRHNHVNMQFIHVNIRHNIIDTQNNSVYTCTRDNYDTIRLRRQNYVAGGHILVACLH